MKILSVRPLPAIIIAGLVAGILNLAGAAMIVGGSPMHGFQLIASGVLGERAFSGGLGAAVLGALLHFTISIVAATIYWAAAGRMNLLQKHWLMGGAAFGLIAYIVMNLIVVPLSSAPPSHPSLRVVIEDLFAHVLLFGLPIAGTLNLIRFRDGPAAQRPSAAVG
jgi:hypothetical protein